MSNQTIKLMNKFLSLIEHYGATQLITEYDELIHSIGLINNLNGNEIISFNNLIKNRSVKVVQEFLSQFEPSEIAQLMVKKNTMMLISKLKSETIDYCICVVRNNLTHSIELIHYKKFNFMSNYYVGPNCYVQMYKISNYIDFVRLCDFFSISFTYAKFKLSNSNLRMLIEVDKVCGEIKFFIKEINEPECSYAYEVQNYKELVQCVKSVTNNQIFIYASE